MPVKTVIAKNITGSPVDITDLGVLNILGGAQVALSDYFRLDEIQESVSLSALISAASVVINDGTVDLTLAQSLIYITPAISDIDVDVALENFADITEATQEPTGFPNRTDTTLSWNDGTRTLTLGLVGPSADVWVDGIKRTLTVALTCTIADTEGEWYFYVDTAGVLTATATFTLDLISPFAWVASVYWDAVNNVAIYVADERHGVVMDAQTHAYLHTTVGAAFESGLGLTGLTVDGSGDLAIHAQCGVADGVIRDEDIHHAITDGAPQDLSPVAAVPVYYRTGSGIWRRATADAFPFIYSGKGVYTGANGRIPFNQFSVGVWSLVEISTLNYVLVHLFATNNIAEPIVAIQGIAEYGSLGAARTGAEAEILSLSGLPFAEFVALGTIIVQSAASYLNTPKARFRSTTDGGEYIDWRNLRVSSIVRTLQVNAIDVSVDASAFSGTVLGPTDTNVQTALKTLDSAVDALSAGPGTGDVVGPASATGNSFAIYDGATGKLLKSQASPQISALGDINMGGRGISNLLEIATGAVNVAAAGSFIIGAGSAVDFGNTAVANFGAIRYNTVTAALGTNQNNYSPAGFVDCAILRLNPSAAVTITGFLGGFGVGGGERTILANVGAFAITFGHESASSSTQNRLTMPLARSMILGPGRSVEMHYDTTTLRWVMHFPPNERKTVTMSIGIDTGVVGTGAKKPTLVRCPFAGVIRSWTLVADVATTATLDVWKLAGAVPTNANTITAAAKPSLAAASVNSSSTLTGWTTAVAVGDVFMLEVEANSAAAQLTITLEVEVL